MNTFIEITVAAKLAGLSLRQFRRNAVDSGKVPAHRIGKRSFVMRVTLETFLAKRTK